jgi:hypothetical protein
VFYSRLGSGIFSLTNRPDHSGGHSLFSAVKEVSVPREKSDPELKLTAVLDTVPRFRLRELKLK